MALSFYNPYQYQQPQQRDPNAGRIYGGVTQQQSPMVSPAPGFGAPRPTGGGGGYATPRPTQGSNAAGMVNQASSVASSAGSLYGMFGGAGSGAVAAAAPYAGAYGLAIGGEMNSPGSITGSTWGDLGLSFATGGFTSALKGLGLF